MVLLDYDIITWFARCDLEPRTRVVGRDSFANVPRVDGTHAQSASCIVYSAPILFWDVAARVWLIVDANDAKLVRIIALILLAYFTLISAYKEN